jgi:hypothetical protein
MSTQPETLRLADFLDSEDHMISSKHIVEAADELRRLHELNQDLLNALHCISLAAQDSGSTREGMGLYARAAIAKARGGE